MRKNYQASYTVEATYVMSMVIFAVVILIRTGYAQSQEITGSLKLHHRIYQLRGQEEAYRTDFTVGQWMGSACREGDQIWGTVESMGEQLEIRMKTNDPEEMMRRLTIFQSDGQEKTNGEHQTDGDRLPPGDEE